MSTTIDSKVVEMRFDNSHFENNVSTTMSTLDKLKQKLHLDGATKGLENINTASKKVDMNGLGAAVETVQTKFSAMQVVAVTALANITNSAVNAGKRMISALTIDPVKTGFQEYETQINAVQTILANTKSKGSTIDDVNAALDELNKYADMTIYNFTEMTRNIGTFTAAGVDLETSVNAIQGIANLAAVSGSTSQQASTAMYQLSQALSSGTVKLMDWNSVVNAGMGGEMFQNALKKTSEELGTGAEAAIKASGSFRESLKEGWLTAEVLTATLKKFTTSGANEYVAEYTGLSQQAVEAAIKEGEAVSKAAAARGEEVDAIDAAAEALAKKSGKNKKEIYDMLDFARSATDAATKVKTFSQLWDVLKESAQSGWSQTWKLIIGDFEEAKSLLTPLADTLTGFINKMSDARNRVLQIALDFAAPWKALSDKLKGLTEVTDKVKNVTESLEYFQDVVNKVWRGDYNNWGDNPDRFDLLEKAGYDHRVVQDLVNKGYKYKLTVEDIEASHKKFGLTMETTTEETENVTEAVNKLTDEQLENAGLTEDEIRLYRALEKEADRLGISIDDLAEEMSNTSGRDLLVESFKNIGNVFVGIGQAIKTAWIDIFNPPGLEEMGIRLYGMIRSLRDFTESLRLVDTKTGELTITGLKFQRIFKGIFALIDIVLTIVGGPIKIAFKLVTQLLNVLGLGILDVAAFIGDIIVKFDEWLNRVLDFTGVFEKLINPIKNGIEAFKAWIATLRESENLPQDIAKGIASGFGKAFTAVKNFFKNIPTYFKNGFDGLSDSPLGSFIAKLGNGLKIAGQTIVELGKIILAKINGFLSAKGFKTISEDSIAGLVNGFKDGASKVWEAAVNMAKMLVQKVKDFLGIHSPSKVFFAIGGFIIAGLISGLQNGVPDALGGVKDVIQPILDWVGGIDLGALFGGVIGMGTVATGYKAVNALSSFASMFEGIGEVLQSSAKFVDKMIRPVQQVVKGFAKLEKAVAFNLKMDGVKTLATSLLMLVAAIAILTFIEPKKLWNAVLIVLALAGILAGLAFAMSKLNDASASFSFKEGMSIKSLSSGLIGIGAAILLIGMTVKMIGKLNPEQAEQGLKGLIGIITAVGALLIAFMKIPFGPDDAVVIANLGKTMKQIGIALLIMAIVAKMLGKMDEDTLIQGGRAIVAFGGIIVGLMAATKLINGSKNVEHIGKTLLKIAIAIGVMAIVAKMLGKMDEDELKQGTLAIVAFSGIIVGLMAATKVINGSKNIDSMGKTLFKIGLAFVAMAIVVKLLGNMEPSEITKGLLVITAFGGIIVGLMAATKLINGSKNVGKIGVTILAISGAIAVMALTAFMLSLISWEGFAKGAIMIGAFSSMIVGLIAATKLVGNDADKIGKSILSIAGAIAIIALVAVLLSLVETQNLVKGIIVIGILSGIISGLIYVTKFSKDCMTTVLAIAGIIAVLGIVVWTMSKIPAESVISSAVGLSILLIAVGVVMKLLDGFANNWKNALIGVGLLTAMAVPLLAFVGVLACMQNVQNALSNTMALAILATTLTLLLIPLTIVGAFIYPALLGVVALTAMAVPLLAFVGILALMQNIQNAQANSQILIALMTTIADVLIKISLVAPLAVIAVTALTALVSVMVAVGVLAAAIGALVTKFPQLQTFLDVGIPILVQMAGGLGQMVGAFVSALAGEIMVILPQLGTYLSQFMINATPFIEGAKMVDGSVLGGVAILAGAIIAFTAADLMAGVVSFLQGGSSFADLGTQLSQFMINALPFITTAAMITPEMLSGVRALAETILILTAANVLEGLTSFFTGGSSLENFAAQLPILGQGLVAFSASLGTFTEDQLNTVNCAAQAVKTLASAAAEIPNTGGLLASIVGENDLGVFAAQFPVLGSGIRQFLDNVGTFSEEQVATVDCAAQAIKLLAQASSEIPNSGGWLGQIVGENDLSIFAEQFPILGTGLAAFLTNVGTFSEEQVATVDCAAQAIKLLAQASSEIPNSGGWLGQIVGENDLATFAEQFPKLGTGLAGFLANVGTFTPEQVATVDCAAQAVKTLASVASEIPNEGGWLAKIVGDNDLGTFAGNFPKLGEGLAGFAEKLGTFDPSKVATVNAGVSAIKAIATLANVDLGSATKHIGGFSDKLPKVASNVADFCENMPSVESSTNAVNSLNKILDAVSNIANVNSGALATFADNLKKVGKKAVNNFIEAFTSNTAKTDLNSAAKKLGDKVVDGIESKESDIKKSAKKAAEKAVDGVETQEDDMKSAGKDLGKGLVKGIEAKYDAAYNAGYKLGQKAVQGEKDGQKSNSPSKLTIQAGKWLGEGLVIGMGKMGNQVYKAGSTLGETATNTLSSTISRISDMVNTDIDSQPTIRPVLDLSDVKTGASALSGMLNMDSTVGVRANVGVISSMMNQRSQNGVNDDVVSELAKLRKDIGNMNNTTYNVNGVTYDDGSNITDAVRTIVHAAQIERRI